MCVFTPRKSGFFISMFTGIISHTGTVTKKSSGALAVATEPDFVKNLKDGMSVAVNGVCLTITAYRKNSFNVDVMPETMKRTSMDTIRPGMLVNLEFPATPQTFLSGHLVQGHVDGVAKLTHISKEGSAYLLTFSASSPLSRYIVEKGSVALNGISLTVIDARKASFTVGIIPHTWKETMLHTIQVGDIVNVETDVIAKYLEKLINKK